MFFEAADEKGGNKLYYFQYDETAVKPLVLKSTDFFSNVPNDGIKKPADLPAEVVHECGGQMFVDLKKTLGIDVEQDTVRQFPQLYKKRFLVIHGLQNDPQELKVYDLTKKNAPPVYTREKTILFLDMVAPEPQDQPDTDDVKPNSIQLFLISADKEFVLETVNLDNLDEVEVKKVKLVNDGDDEEDEQNS